MHIGRQADALDFLGLFGGDLVVQVFGNRVGIDAARPGRRRRRQTAPARHLPDALHQLARLLALGHLLADQLGLRWIERVVEIGQERPQRESKIGRHACFPRFAGLPRHRSGQSRCGYMWDLARVFVQKNPGEPSGVSRRVTLGSPFPLVTAHHHGYSPSDHSAPSPRASLRAVGVVRRPRGLADSPAGLAPTRSRRRDHVPLVLLHPAARYRAPQPGRRRPAAACRRRSTSAKFAAARRAGTVLSWSTRVPPPSKSSTSNPAAAACRRTSSRRRSSAARRPPWSSSCARPGRPTGRAAGTCGCATATAMPSARSCSSWPPRSATRSRCSRASSRCTCRMCCGKKSSSPIGACPHQR